MVAETVGLSVGEAVDTELQATIPKEKQNNARIFFILFFLYAMRPTVCVSGGQGGRGKSLRAEKTGSQKNAYKSRRLPAVRCIIPVHFRVTALGSFSSTKTLTVTKSPK